MAKFTGSYQERFFVPSPPEVVAQHFGDLQQIIRHYGPIERADILGPDVLRLTLQEKGLKGVSFQPIYTVRYERSPGLLCWSTTESQSMWSTGEARFEAAPGGTSVDYKQSIQTEIPVPRLLAGMVEGVVRREIEAGVVAYLQRMRAAVPR